MDTIVRAILAVIGSSLIILVPWLYARWLSRDIRRRLSHVHGEGRAPIMGGPQPANIAEVLAMVQQVEYQDELPVGVASVLLQRHQMTLAPGVRALPTPVVVAAAVPSRPLEREGLPAIAADNHGEFHGIAAAIAIPPNHDDDNLDGEPGGVTSPAIAVAVPVHNNNSNVSPPAGVPAVPIGVADGEPVPGAAIAIPMEPQPEGQVLPMPSAEAEQLSAGHQRILTCYPWTTVFTYTTWSLIYALINVPLLWSHVDKPPLVTTDDGSEPLGLPVVGLLNGVAWILPPLIANIVVSHTLLDVSNVCTDSSFTHRGRVFDHDMDYIIGSALIMFYEWDGTVIMGGMSLIADSDIPYAVASIIVFVVILFWIGRRKTAWVKERRTFEEARLSLDLRRELLEMATHAGCNDPIPDGMNPLPGDERHGVAAQRGSCLYDCCFGGGRCCRTTRYRYDRPIPERKYCCACLCTGSLSRIDVITDKDRPLVTNAMTNCCGNVVFTTPLVRRFSDNQVRAIFAHELGHVRYSHPRRIGCTFALAFIIVAISWFLVPVALHQLVFPCHDYEHGPCDWWSSEQYSEWYAMMITFRWMPLAVCTLCTVLFGVLRYFQRRFEYQADQYAARIMGGNGDLISALAELHDGSRLPVSYTGWWQSIWFTHPSLIDRFAALGVHVPIVHAADQEPLL